MATRSRCQIKGQVILAQHRWLARGCLETAVAIAMAVVIAAAAAMATVVAKAEAVAGGWWRQRRERRALRLVSVPMTVRPQAAAGCAGPLPRPSGDARRRGTLASYIKEDKEFVETTMLISELVAIVRLLRRQGAVIRWLWPSADVQTGIPRWESAPAGTDHQ